MTTTKELACYQEIRIGSKFQHRYKHFNEHHKHGIKVFCEVIKSSLVFVAIYIKTRQLYTCSN